MNLRRLIVLVGALVVIAGVIGLLVPVSVPGPDNGSIGCGSGLAQDLSAAQEADHNNPANLPILNAVLPHTEYAMVVIAGSFFVGSRAVSARTP